MPALLFRRFVLREKSAPPTGCLIPALEITLFQGFRKKQNSRQENSRWGGRKQRFDKLWVWTSSTQVLHCCFVYIVAMVASPAYRWLWAIKRIQRLVLKRQRLSEVCCQGYKNHNALINCPTWTSITLKSPFFWSFDDSWNHYNCTLRCLNDLPAHCKCKLWGLTKKKKKRLFIPVTLGPTALCSLGSWWDHKVLRQDGG